MWQPFHQFGHLLQAYALTPYQIPPAGSIKHRVTYGFLSFYTLQKHIFRKYLNASNFWTVHNVTILASPPQKLACSLSVFSIAWNYEIYRWSAVIFISSFVKIRQLVHDFVGGGADTQVWGSHTNTVSLLKKNEWRLKGEWGAICNEE
jgi:hypothetical protein